MAEGHVQSLVALLLVALFVAFLTKKIRVPYTVALVLVGLASGALWGGEPIELDQDLILFIFLPPLLFEGCLNMDLEVLRRNALAVILLAVPGIALTVLGLGAAIRGVFGLEWMEAFLVAAIFAPTDPVSVLAVFKELGVVKDLAVSVEGESVFNDGIGVVIYLIIIQIMKSGPEASGGPGAWGILFLQEVGIGVLVGLLLGGLAQWVLGLIDDHQVEVVFSLLLAYGSYVAAHALHGSGVIAVVGAGLILGNYGRIFSMSPTTRITLSAFWDIVAFLANSLVFLLIGTATHPGDVVQEWRPILITFGLLMALRAAVTFGLMEIPRRLSGRPPIRWTCVIFWGGLRGTIPIALVLGLESELGQEIAEAHRPLVFGVVLLSLLIQGLTIRSLLGALGLVGRGAEEEALEQAEGRALAARAAEHELEQMRKHGEIPPSLYEEMRVGLEQARRRTAEELHELVRAQSAALGARRRHARIRVLEAQRVALQLAARRGVISDEVLHALTREIDAQLAEDPRPARKKGPPEPPPPESPAP